MCAILFVEGEFACGWRQVGRLAGHMLHAAHVRTRYEYEAYAQRQQHNDHLERIVYASAAEHLKYAVQNLKFCK